MTFMHCKSFFEVIVMSERKYSVKEYSDVPGTPFEPLGIEDLKKTANLRVIPYQISYPSYPLNYSFIRNAGTDMSERT